MRTQSAKYTDKEKNKKKKKNSWQRSTMPIDSQYTHFFECFIFVQRGFGYSAGLAFFQFFFLFCCIIDGHGPQMRMGGLAVLSSRLMPSSVRHKTENNVLERERNFGLFIFFWASAAVPRYYYHQVYFVYCTITMIDQLRFC